MELRDEDRERLRHVLFLPPVQHEDAQDRLIMRRLWSSAERGDERALWTLYEQGLRTGLDRIAAAFLTELSHIDLAADGSEAVQRALERADARVRAVAAHFRDDRDWATRTVRSLLEPDLARQTEDWLDVEAAPYVEFQFMHPQRAVEELLHLAHNEFRSRIAWPAATLQLVAFESELQGLADELDSLQPRVERLERTECTASETWENERKAVRETCDRLLRRIGALETELRRSPWMHVALALEAWGYEGSLWDVPLERYEPLAVAFVALARRASDLCEVPSRWQHIYLPELTGSAPIRS